MMRSVGTATTAFALAALAVSISGCKQPSACPGFAICGGALPVGDWVLDMGHPSCSDDLYTPAADPRLVGGDLPAARTPPPEPALYDWCSLLVATDAPDPKDTAYKLPNPYAESAPIGVALIHYDDKMKFKISTTRTGTFKTDFPGYCMRAFGAVDSGGLTVCQKLTMSLNSHLPKRYKNINCAAVAADPQGCVCSFDLSDFTESSGILQSVGGGEMVHLFSNNFPQSVSYCLQGDSLQLMTSNDEYLFDRLGLRTLSLVRNTKTINCTDHMQGYGEDGVDCGPACPVFCADINCFDGAKGPGEDGVDCGPNCPTAVCPPMPPAM
jgi:hypothetical protein